MNAFISTLVIALSLIASPTPLLASHGGTCTGDQVHVGNPTNGSYCIGGANNNPIYVWVEFMLNWMIRLLIVAAVIMVVVSAIQYITSQGNPDAMKGAKSRLINVITGLILLSLTYVILGFLGVLG